MLKYDESLVIPDNVLPKIFIFLRFRVRCLVLTGIFSFTQILPLLTKFGYVPKIFLDENI